MPEAPRITADELQQRMHAGEEFVIVDTRNPQAWAESGDKAARAQRIPLDELQRHLPQLPKTKPIVAYCT
jgi:rhodanese-related sulfurtransferase